MSDTPNSSGWWQASDGNWYPPESHPNYSPRLPPPTATLTAPRPQQFTPTTPMVVPVAKKHKKVAWRRWWAIGLGAIFILVVVAIASAPPDEPGDTTGDSASASTSSWEDRLAKKATDSNFIDDWQGATVDAGRLTITIASAENLTEGLTKDSARLAAARAVEAAQGAEMPPEITEVIVVVRYDLVNQYGEVSEDDVIMATFTRETVDRMVFDNLDGTEILRASDQTRLWVHPAFAYSDGS